MATATGWIAMGHGVSEAGVFGISHPPLAGLQSEVAGIFQQRGEFGLIGSELLHAAHLGEEFWVLVAFCLVDPGGQGWFVCCQFGFVRVSAC